MIQVELVLRHTVPIGQENGGCLPGNDGVNQLLLQDIKRLGCLYFSLGSIRFHPNATVPLNSAVP